jgi:hypothetical protein
MKQARGSVIACAACLDASVAKRFASWDRIQAGKEMLVRIVTILTKLLMRFDPEQYRVHESAAGLLRHSSTSIQERRAFFGCRMNTFSS